VTAADIVPFPVRGRVPPPIDVEPDASAATLVQAAIGAAVRRLLRHDPGVRRGDDPEDVHQARVATRRLRSDLRTFAPLVDRDWADGIRHELDWLASELGAVRDADVLTLRLHQHAAALPPADQPRAQGLLGRLGDQRDAARSSLLAALDSVRYSALVSTLLQAAATPALTDKAAGKARESLPPLVARAWGRLEQAVKELPADPADDDLHQVRIRAKRARYAAEAAAPVVGKPARAFASAVAGVQSVLGDLQDAVVAEEWLRDAASTARGGTGVVAGQLVVRQQQARAEARDEWPAAWKKASRKKLRAWLD
jgi:CHAD domain-containing protein